jgi:hypothetical protein
MIKAQAPNVKIAFTLPDKARIATHLNKKTSIFSSVMGRTDRMNSSPRPCSKTSLSQPSALAIRAVTSP